MFFYRLKYLFHKNKENECERLVSGSDDFTMFLWNPEVDKKTIARMTGHQQLINDVRFSPDTRLIASASFDKSIRLWNIHTGVCIRTVTGHSGSIWLLQLLQNNQLASASDDQSFKIWNINTGECLRTLTNHSNWVRSQQLLPNNKLASGSAETTIKILKNKMFVRYIFCFLYLDDRFRLNVFFKS